MSIPQGRIVGGSTKLNRMVFDRGSQSDFDRWAELGNDGWDFEGLLPYFKKVREAVLECFFVIMLLDLTADRTLSTARNIHPSGCGYPRRVSHRVRLGVPRRVWTSPGQLFAILLAND